MMNKTYYDGYGYNFYYGNYGYYEYSVVPINYAPYAAAGVIASCCIAISCYLIFKYVKLDGDDDSDDDVIGNINPVDVDIYNADMDDHMFRKEQGSEGDRTLACSPLDLLPVNKV